VGGIAGVLGAGSLEKLCAAALAMLRAEAHRGPDDEGLVALMTAEPVCQTILGSRRLAVVDSSREGNQPMQNENGTVWAVFDGEIYNGNTLRKELLSKGHRFRSRTNTDVLLHLYEEYGDGCLSRLRGMFAIAIWDHKARRLILARDRLGEKPLYYAWDGTRFVFASEIKALLVSGLVTRRLNPAAVSAYLNLGWVPSPLTIVDGVKSLEPGSLASFQNGQLQIKRYWDLVFKEDNSLDEAQAVGPLREHLQEAVRLRLHSDVPIGAFISGGVDSSAMLSFMRESVTGKLHTFSFAFEQPELNEGPRARALADRFQTDHTEYLITSQEILRELSFIVAAMDQPSVDGINSYFASKIARSSGTVVALSDLGGDQLFGGYSSFWLAPRILQLGRSADTPWESGKALEALLSWLPRGGRSRQIAALLRRAPFLEVAYLAAKGLFLDDVLEHVLSERFVNGSGGFDPLVYLQDIGHGYSESLSNRICRLELRTDLHNQLLRDTDAMSMAHSLELRSPFLDHPLVEFLAKVPSQVKFSSKPKRLLIQAMSGKLPVQPGDRINGPSNSPFGFWLKNRWRGLAEELLCGRTVMSVDLFDRDGLRRLWDDFLRNRIGWSRIWAVLILQLWIRRHIDGEISLLPPGFQFVRRG